MNNYLFEATADESERVDNLIKGPSHSHYSFRTCGVRYVDPGPCLLDARMDGWMGG